MRRVSIIKYCSLAFYILLLLAEITSSSPCYSNYENSEEVDNTKGQEYQIKNRSLGKLNLGNLNNEHLRQKQCTSVNKIGKYVLCVIGVHN
ncbi:hypothetical protein RUM43_000705 [Polyplax serrata]|uniref:Uncharacterized protein n=1 Tax=Polyplax serrata TaxID=468196 RepID=A0AAN8XNH4_POLSC